jgi:hypothetical protein
MKRSYHEKGRDLELSVSDHRCLDWGHRGGSWAKKLEPEARGAVSVFLESSDVEKAWVSSRAL